jgi:RNA recognition motif-containing protein
MPVRLYVGNLPKEPIERQALQEMFADAGDLISTKVIKDRKTGKCRGFAFVTVPTDEVADQFIEKYNGQSFMDSPLKIEKALPREKGKEKEESTSQAQEQSSPEPVAASSSTNSSGRKSSKKRPRSQGNNSTGGTGSEGFQPDPRWADKLAQLRDMLAAQSN